MVFIGSKALHQKTAEITRLDLVDSAMTPPTMNESTVTRYSECNLPTEYGTFRVIAYRETGVPAEHLAIACGDLSEHGPVLCRVHSECLTGEVLHSLKCDCKEQLDMSLKRIAAEGRGVVLYLRQEGRGIGLGDKIRVYQLQEQGRDTVDANRELGFPDDLRTYDMAAAMLHDLNVSSVTLMTNNPLKVEALRKHGVEVADRIAHVVEANPHSRGYLETKRTRMGHLLDEDAGNEGK